jgi:hypothetical protein
MCRNPSFLLLNVTLRCVAASETASRENAECFTAYGKKIGYDIPGGTRRARRKSRNVDIHDVNDEKHKAVRCVTSLLWLSQNTNENVIADILMGELWLFRRRMRRASGTCYSNPAADRVRSVTSDLVCHTDPEGRISTPEIGVSDC